VKKSNGLSKELIEVVMGADPDPNHGFTGTLPDGTIFFIDGNGADVVITIHLGRWGSSN
jgi:hypothetical protein